LEQTIRHIQEGEDHLARQQTFIAELRRNGQDAKDAEAFLVVLETTQSVHIMDRDRLQRELGEHPDAR
jgi:hypothetical protein